MTDDASAPVEACFDPLFQLNLVLHMALPRPQEHGPAATGTRRSVRPLFSEAGYELWCLPGAISLPNHVIRTFAEATARTGGEASTGKPTVNRSVKPDVVMRSTGRRRILILELKSTGFGEESGDVIQLRSYMCLVGDYAAVALGERTGAGCSLCLGYMTFDGRLHMDETMAQVARGVECLDLQTCEEYGHVSMAYMPGGIVALRVPDEPVLAGHPLSGEGRIQVVAGASLDECRPLYLIPYYPGLLPDAEQAEYAKDMLRHRVVQHVFWVVAQHIGDSETVELGLDGIARGVMDTVWDCITDSQARRSLVSKVIAPAVRRAVSALEKAGFGVAHNGLRRCWQISLPADAQRRLVRAMKAMSDPSVLSVDNEQPSLFDF